MNHSTNARIEHREDVRFKLYKVGDHLMKGYQSEASEKNFDQKHSIFCTQKGPAMAFLLSKASTVSRFVSSSTQKVNPSFLQSSHRGLHIELGAREKALLEPHPVLKPFKSTKKAEHLVRRFGDVLALAVISGGCYEVYVRTTSK
ncbi:hypothetical protein MKW98_004082 [Papaver atlanticum]|uniref:Uncharacterized protein n=1 Tax=Papaver atlanticum TaxID=357466 RepID=A0AAD4T295_9MAGN|nr:hypothetical protein MKW98_004082 [Papaver atlanticum]